MIRYTGKIADFCEFSSKSKFGESWYYALHYQAKFSKVHALQSLQCYMNDDGHLKSLFECFAYLLCADYKEQRRHQSAPLTRIINLHEHKSNLLIVFICNSDTHCSKSSFFVQKFNFDFPRKLSTFLGEKLVKMLRFWTF